MYLISVSNSPSENLGVLSNGTKSCSLSGSRAPNTTCPGLEYEPKPYLGHIRGLE